MARTKAKKKSKARGKGKCRTCRDKRYVTRWDFPGKLPCPACVRAA